MAGLTDLQSELQNLLRNTSAMNSNITGPERQIYLDRLNSAQTGINTFDLAQKAGYQVNRKSDLADAEAFLKGKNVDYSGFVPKTFEELQNQALKADSYQSATQSGVNPNEIQQAYGDYSVPLNQQQSQLPDAPATETGGGITRKKGSTSMQNQQHASSNSVRIQTPDGQVHSVMKGSNAEQKYLDAGGQVTQEDKTSGKQQPLPPSSLDVITDPVTGNAYARDLSIPGSTYKPYTPQPQAPSTDIAPPKDTGYSDSLLESYGYKVDKNAAEMFKIAPAKSFSEVYSSLTKDLGLSNVKKQMESITKQMGSLDQELADKISDINDNPWLSEGVRVSQIQKLQDRYDLKRAPFASNLQLLEGLYADGQEEARYVATQALNQYNQERQFSLDQIQFMIDRADKQQEAQLRLYEASQKGPDYGPGAIGEYQFAVQNGYTGTFSQYQNEDANRKARIAGAGTGSGLTPYQENQTFIGITNKFQADSIINAAFKGNTAVAIADQIIANPNSATSQLKSLYALVKNLDPDSAVREGELALANQTQSYLQTFGNSIARISEGRVIDPKAATALAQATKELAVAWNQTAAKRQQLYQAQAQVGNVGNQFNQYIQSSGIDFGGAANDPLGLR